MKEGHQRIQKQQIFKVIAICAVVSAYAGALQLQQSRMEQNWLKEDDAKWAKIDKANQSTPPTVPSKFEQLQATRPVNATQ